MKTEQINIRLKHELVAALERVAREESLDRSTAIQRLLETSIREWEVQHALRGYQRGELSLGRAAEEAGLTQWELIDLARAAGIAYPLRAEDVEQRLGELGGDGGDRAGVSRATTLPDVPPRPGGVLLVGINPAPVSAAAGHYYQGRLGKRLWRRLERLGLLPDALPGAEDEAFARAGHGLTDLVKRPTPSSAELAEEELRAGIDEFRSKVKAWRPGLILFAFKDPARRLLGGAVAPGRGPSLDGVPTFLLSSPYAPRAEADRVDAELRSLLASVANRPEGDGGRSRRVTAADLERGQIRLPRPAKRFFPAGKLDLAVILRGARVEARYDPTTGPGRERSAVLRVGKAELGRLVKENEVLRVSRGLGGIVRLD